MVMKKFDMQMNFFKSVEKNKCKIFLILGKLANIGYDWNKVSVVVNKNSLHVDIRNFL